METQRRKAFIINAIYFLLVFALIFVFFRYVIKIIMPFVIALAIAAILQPVIRVLHRKLRFEQTLAAIISVILFYGTVGVILVLLLIQIFSAAKDLFTQIPAVYRDLIEPALNQFMNTLQELVTGLDPELAATLDNMLDTAIESVGSAITNFSVSIVSSLTNYATAIPSFLISMLITVISTFFIAVEYHEIFDFLGRQMEEKTRSLIQAILRVLRSTVFKYGKSYAIILLMTFSELFIGLSIIGIPNAALIAAAIAVFDILPVVGSGAVLIPWILVSFIQGRFMRAIGLLILYIVLVIVRNVTEPKIVGHQVGMPPLVTLICMIVGTALFGGIGLFGLPIAMAVFITLDAHGTINVIRKKPQTNPELLDNEETDLDKATKKLKLTVKKKLSRLRKNHK